MHTILIAMNSSFCPTLHSNRTTNKKPNLSDSSQGGREVGSALERFAAAGGAADCIRLSPACCLRQVHAARYVLSVCVCVWRSHVGVITSALVIKSHVYQARARRMPAPET